MFAPTPGHLCISEYGGDSGQRNQGTKENGGSGKDPGTLERSGRNEGDRAYVCSLALLGTGPGDRIRRCNWVAGQRGQVPGCPG